MLGQISKLRNFLHNFLCVASLLVEEAPALIFPFCKISYFTRLKDSHSQRNSPGTRRVPGALQTGEMM